MLTKLCRTQEVEALPLACDQALLRAQVAAAGELPEDDHRIQAALSTLPEGLPEHARRAAANKALGLAVLARYRGSSDAGELLATPDDVTYVHLRGLTPRMEREADRRAGPPPRLGARAYARALAALADVDAEDAEARNEAHARHIDALPLAEREAFHAFELWHAEREAQRAAMCIVRITEGLAPDAPDICGFEAGPAGYPVDLLPLHIKEGAAVIAEAAAHARQLSTLGKAETPSSQSSRGQGVSPTGPQAAPGPAGPAAPTEAA